MLGAGQGAAAGSNATHEVARKAAIAGAGAGSGGAETGAGSPSVRSPPSTAHASRECTLPAPPAARAGTPAAAASKQAQLAASFEAKSAQLLQQFVAFRSQRTLPTDDRCLGWGRKFVSPQPAAIRRFQCPFTPAAVRNIGCPPCSTDGCGNFGTEVCYNCKSSLCIACDDCRHGSGGGLPSPHLHRRVTYRHGYRQQKVRVTSLARGPGVSSDATASCATTAGGEASPPRTQSACLPLRCRWVRKATSDADVTDP